MKKNRTYEVVAKWYDCYGTMWRIVTTIEGENSLERAQELVKKNKATSDKWGMNASCWFRRA